MIFASSGNQSTEFRLILLVLSVFAVLACSITILGQKEEQLPAPASQSHAVLIDSGNYVNGESESLRIDSLRTYISSNPGAAGTILVFCGNPCKSGEIEAHLKGIEISLMDKGTTGITARLGGYRDTFTLEYWAIPADACSPVPDSKISINKVRFKGRIKSNKFVPYDCCGYPDDRVVDLKNK